MHERGLATVGEIAQLSEQVLTSILGRAAGITSYLLLVGLVLFGLVLSHPARARWRRPSSATRIRVHVSLSVFTLVFTVLHIVVLATAVRRLSNRAACDGVLVISDQKSDQSTLTAIATKGRTTNSAPSSRDIRPAWQRDAGSGRPHPPHAAHSRAKRQTVSASCRAALAPVATVQ